MKREVSGFSKGLMIIESWCSNSRTMTKLQILRVMGLTCYQMMRECWSGDSKVLGSFF